MQLIKTFALRIDIPWELVVPFFLYPICKNIKGLLIVYLYFISLMFSLMIT